MAASEAQIRPNQASTKDRDRRRDRPPERRYAAEVERQFAELQEELQPSGEVGQALARRAAVCSVRMDRAVLQETASLSERVRKAEADFQAPEGVNAVEAERLRAEAGARAMFDPSQEATLARRYEASAERGFFRALKERDCSRGKPTPPNPPWTWRRSRRLWVRFWRSIIRSIGGSTSSRRSIPNRPREPRKPLPRSPAGSIRPISRPREGVSTSRS